MTQQINILIIENEPDSSESYVSAANNIGYSAIVVKDIHKAMQVMQSEFINLIIIDTNASTESWSGFIKSVNSEAVTIPVIVVSSNNEVQHAVDVMRQGAVDYWVKPVSVSKAEFGIAKHAKRAIAENVILESEKSKRLYALASRVAASEVSVLISGESGAGKEVVARFIHGASNRSKGPFVAINCAAIPENMLEALLFGYEKGAFTGALQTHAGKFEQAQGGTLLLDEISEIAPALQAKLLRVLQEKEVERICGSQPIPLNVRVLATTNRNLKEEVKQGRFREDLYYRLNVFPLHLNPLRERADDILPLANSLIQKHSINRGIVPSLTPEAEMRLLGYKWPGNVRELENVIQRALILATGDQIDDISIQYEEEFGQVTDKILSVDAQELEIKGGNEQVSLEDQVRHSEHETIIQVMKKVNGSRKDAAQILGISSRTLRYKLAKLRDSGYEVPAAYSAQCA
ncbi:MAG: sigma-54-dependent Fis family transcriptional regulator [Gammaproteobacteria bacterium]|nr:MAG: sigma-54-dependent Fis family transcriptional regulator [Gammaproteobacteria bacterium]